ncbi:lytic transglycosylase domain-containing protein [Thiorhodococcus minor]|uniref:Transglycosylase SLT domain-containing protein n=1 Tax=Thiorhodococcus minor TaxID=57489 RepID=A0A6M0K413_9GAMM|nr:lytic transglycosylase domain-containing protein [Thiorhodococcus minor]NEV64532.1 transglycosylase SLT domain-containing protein [Thiorhodococcus minor]
MRPAPISSRMLWVSACFLPLVFLAGCASTGGGQHGLGPEIGESGINYGASREFPVPDDLQDNVDFWRHVYGIWSRGEVAIHDDEHLGVVYEVVQLPGSIQGGYSSAQKSLVRARKRHYEAQLASLERRLRAGERLSGIDKAIARKFKRHGGAGAIYGASERVRSQRGLRERFKRGVEISGRYDDIFRDIMRKYGVPEDLAYLPHVESSFQTHARSSAGAGGVWQFMPSTGRQYMRVDSAIDERFDPILAADGAARYLAQAHAKLGSWPLAITSYNHGQGGMAKAKAQHGNDIGRIVNDYKGRYFGFASRNFYAEFVAAREVARHPNRYFSGGVRYEKPWPHDRLVLRYGMPADHLAQHYGTSKYRLADLNMHWRKKVVNGKTHIPAGATVWLPTGSMKRVASHPPRYTAPVLVASTRASRPTVRSTQTIAKAKKSAKPVARARPAPKARARYHVVKPQETLYRVAVKNGITVSQLRKLNKMRPDDTKIRPGQKLIVGI